MGSLRRGRHDAFCGFRAFGFDFFVLRSRFGRGCGGVFKSRNSSSSRDGVAAIWVFLAMAEELPDFSKVPGLNPIIAEMHSQSDRGAAICGGAFVEQHLQDAIEKMWPPISNTVRERLFTGFGPLSSFSAKIALGQAMGVLAPTAKGDIDKIRLIRNDAAHVGMPFSFDSPENRKRLSEIVMLRYFPDIGHTYHASPERNKFSGAVNLAVMYLWMNVSMWKLKFGHHAVMPALGEDIPSQKRRTKSSSDSNRGS